MLLLFAVLALVAVYLGYQAVRRARFYRQLFAEPHLAAVAAALPALRQAAIASLDRPEPPEPLLSPLGIVVLYTIRSRPQDGRFVHHISVSLGGGYTPHAVGASFVLFVLRGLGIDPLKVRCGMPPSHIFHAEWIVAAAQHGELTAHAGPVLQNPRAVFDECVRLRPQIPFARLPE